jgi:hypothetical protein
MEPERPLQDPATGPYTDQEESRLHHNSLFLSISFFIVLTSTTRSLNWYFPTDYQTSYFPLIREAYPSHIILLYFIALVM